MHLNQLVGHFKIMLSNEEAYVLDRMKDCLPLSSYPEREQFVIENLIRKGMVAKVIHKGETLVLRNDD